MNYFDPQKFKELVEDIKSGKANDIKSDKPFVSVIYEEYKPETYQGIEVRFDDRTESIFTGNFMTDWITVQQRYGDFLVSSTVNNFMNDMFGGNDNETTS